MAEVHSAVTRTKARRRYEAGVARRTSTRRRLAWAAPGILRDRPPGATPLTGVAKLWRELSLPPDVVVIHTPAYMALTTASNGQQDIRLA